MKKTMRPKIDVLAALNKRMESLEKEQNATHALFEKLRDLDNERIQELEDIDVQQALDDLDDDVGNINDRVVKLEKKYDALDKATCDTCNELQDRVVEFESNVHDRLDKLEKHVDIISAVDNCDLIALGDRVTQLEEQGEAFKQLFDEMSDASVVPPMPVADQFTIIRKQLAKILELIVDDDGTEG